MWTERLSLGNVSEKGGSGWHGDNIKSWNVTFHRCHYTYFRVNLGQYALHHHHYHPFLYHRHSFPFISCHRPSALRDTLLVLSSCHQLPVVSCVTVCRSVGCARGLSSDIKPRAVEAAATAEAERKNGIPNGNNNLTKAPHHIWYYLPCSHHVSQTEYLSCRSVVGRSFVEYPSRDGWRWFSIVIIIIHSNGTVRRECSVKCTPKKKKQKNKPPGVMIEWNLLLESNRGAVETEEEYLLSHQFARFVFQHNNGKEQIIIIVCYSGRLTRVRFGFVLTKATTWRDDVVRCSSSLYTLNSSGGKKRDVEHPTELGQSPSSVSGICSE